MDLWTVSVWWTLTGHRVFNGFVDCECVVDTGRTQGVQWI